MNGLVLDAEHRYFARGERVPGFSEVMKDLGVIKPNPFYTDAGREEGKALHAWLLFLGQGQEPVEPPDPRIAGRVEGIRKFFRESGFVFEGGEQPMFEPNLRFATTPDLYGQIRGVRCVIDAKRGAREPWHPIQTAAGKIALAANGIQCANRYSLYLKDGDYRLVLHEDRTDEDRWRALILAYHAKQFIGG